MTYTEFWDHYLRAHKRPATRAIHYAGTMLATGCLSRGLRLRDWRWGVAAPAIGYGLAWAAHLGIETNKPATFGHPGWSLLSDYRMLGLWATGRLRPHLERAGITTRPGRAT